MNGLAQGTRLCTFECSLGDSPIPFTNSFIDNSRPCDHIRILCGSGHNTPKFVTIGARDQD